MFNIRPKDGKVCISQTYPTTTEMVEKINKNFDRFLACLKDMHINYCTTCVENEELMLYKEMDSVSEKDIKVFKTTCNTVMDFIERLPTSEPAKEAGKEIDNSEKISENIEFCKSILKIYDKTEERFEISMRLGAWIICGLDEAGVALPCGSVSKELFRDLLTSYVEKYGNGNYK